MKKIFLFLGLLALPCIGTAANKKIQMVTYFPTPYVAYSNVQATTALDIGLTGTCEMKLGCDKSGLALRASSAVVVQKGTFDLNAAGRVQSETVTLGKGGGEGTFEFNADLVVTTLKDGQSVEAINMQVDNLYLFPSHTTQDGGRFPKCDDITMSWQKLSDNQTYLVCGAVQEPQECTSHPYYTHEGTASYYLKNGATINVANLLENLGEEQNLCCSGNKITDEDGTEPPESYMEDIEEGKLCCNPKLCCVASDSQGVPKSDASPSCTTDFKNPYALKGASGWACGGDNQVFFYSCTGKGSTEPVCKWAESSSLGEVPVQFDWGYGSAMELAQLQAETNQNVSCANLSECQKIPYCNFSEECSPSPYGCRASDAVLTECKGVGTHDNGVWGGYQCIIKYKKFTCSCN